MKEYLIYSGTICLTKVKARSQKSAENKGKKLLKMSVWAREFKTQ